MAAKSAITVNVAIRPLVFIGAPFRDQRTYDTLEGVRTVRPDGELELEQELVGSRPLGVVR